MIKEKIEYIVWLATSGWGHPVALPTWIHNISGHAGHFQPALWSRTSRDRIGCPSRVTTVFISLRHTRYHFMTILCILWADLSGTIFLLARTLSRLAPWPVNLCPNILFICFVTIHYTLLPVVHIDTLKVYLLLAHSSMSFTVASTIASLHRTLRSIHWLQDGADQDQDYRWPRPPIGSSCQCCSKGTPCGTVYRHCEMRWDLHFRISWVLE